MNLARVFTEAKRVEHALEDDDVAGQSENSFLFVTVFLSRQVEEVDEDRVVEELRAHHEPLHLVADVDRHVALGDHGGGAADLRRPPGGTAAVGAGAEERVLRGGVGDSRETADQLLHDGGEREILRVCFGRESLV